MKELLLFVVFVVVATKLPVEWLFAICVILALLPPKWDPAIRWKERLEKDKDRG